MVLFNITDIKNFMNLLLKEGVFDDFDVRSIDLTTFIKYEIDCTAVTGEDKDTYYKWLEVKPIIFSLVKGKTLPKKLKVIFSYDKNKFAEINENASALYLNLSYENDMLKIITGSSEKTFSLNKAVEISWDDFIGKFLNQNSILYDKQQ